MPVDPMIVNPTLGPFRKMLAEVKGKGLSGPDVDQMAAVLGRMETLAQQMGDVTAYMGQLTQENSFQQFSDAYSRVLAGAARAAAKDMSDEELLAQTLGAYEKALQTHRSGQAGDAAAHTIPTLERILALGRSGVSYPVFLRQVEEQGLMRALSGSAGATREALEKDLAFAKESWFPVRVEQAERILAAYDQLVAEAPFGQPDPLSLELARKRIEWELEPLHRRWTAVVDRWSHVLELLVDWLDAHTSFAPGDERWCPPDGNPAKAEHNIRRTKECAPGDVGYRLAILGEYFQLGFDDIFTHETFRTEYTARRVHWSDARLALIRETFPHCVLGGVAPAALVARAEQLHPHGDVRPDAGKAPPWGTPLATPFG
ncbi:MAG: hypothetical protein JJ863_10740 [Deltaproteobacteria bacterium]|nr:hypothetical protein [Deltaproteobacteria bacterium]